MTDEYQRLCAAARALAAQAHRLLDTGVFPRGDIAEEAFAAIDQTERALSGKERADDNAYVGIYSHRHGVDVDLYFNEADAWHTLAQVALENNDDMHGDDAGDAVALMVKWYRAGDYRSVVAVYNGQANEAHMEVRTVSLTNAHKSSHAWGDEELAAFLPS